MSRSPYIDSVVLTNKHSGKRTNKVQAFVIHHMAAKWTGKRCAEYFRDTPSRQASANYCIGYDGDVALNVEEENRAWTSSSNWADQRAITYELANSKTGHPWEVSDATINKLIIMLAEQHKRYGLNKASYTGDTNGTLWRHDWFASTNCPGPYLGGKLPYIADEVNKILNDVPKENPSTPAKPTKPAEPAPKPVPKPIERIERKYAEKGTFTPNQTIDVYDKPSTNGKKLVQYRNGESVTYHTVHIGNGNVWIQYTRAGGKGEGYLPIRSYANGNYGPVKGRLGDVKVVSAPKPAPKPVEKIERKYAEKGTFTPNQTIDVYDKPSTNGKKLVQYRNGESVTYHTVHIGNGNVWVQYTRAGGKGEGYLPIRSYTNGKYGPVKGKLL